MIPYILHVAVLISVSLLFYKLLLQKETFYRLNRMILVFCMALSFVLPLISIPHQWSFRDSPKVVEAPVQDLTSYQDAIIQSQIDEVKPQAPVKSTPVVAQKSAAVT